MGAGGGTLEYPLVHPDLGPDLDKGCPLPHPDLAGVPLPLGRNLEPVEVLWDGGGEASSPRKDMGPVVESIMGWSYGMEIGYPL